MGRELIKCANCGQNTSLGREDLKINGGFLEDESDVYCSEECRYNAETGNPGEEY